MIIKIRSTIIFHGADILLGSDTYSTAQPERRGDTNNFRNALPARKSFLLIEIEVQAFQPIVLQIYRFAPHKRQKM